MAQKKEEDRVTVALSRILRILDGIIEHQIRCNKIAKEYIINVDAWVRTVNLRISNVKNYSNQIQENLGNTNHNYELILRLKEEVDNVKQGLTSLRLHQLMNQRSYIQGRSDKPRHQDDLG